MCVAWNVGGVLEYTYQRMFDRYKLVLDLQRLHGTIELQQWIYKEINIYIFNISRSIWRNVPPSYNMCELLYNVTIQKMHVC